MQMIQVKNLIFDYFRRDEEGNVESMVEALKDVSLHIEQGAFVSIVGANGSGKTTLAKNLNSLLVPVDGQVLVDGKDTADVEHKLEILQAAGMIFQNPDLQIVGTVVEDDVAFGPENLGVASDEIVDRVTQMLELVGLGAYRTMSPNVLSGGQKQKLAIAGVLAMQPKCMILDEATSMLNPTDRKQIMELAHRLNQESGMTMIHVTHYMDEIVDSDYVYAMSEGRIVFEGLPARLFERKDILNQCRLEIPPSVRHQVFLNGQMAITPCPIALETHEVEFKVEQSLILDHVSYEYKASGAQIQALQDVSLTFKRGEFVGIAGATGAGKSTLLQVLNGLLKPDSGTVYYQGQDVHEKEYPIRTLRQKVGLVFQYPENQLFEETVYKDVAFGPFQMGLSQLEAQKRAFQAIRDMNLSDEIYDMSPFALSGGVKRKVAIASVLAMQPEFLILDEPTAGLDPYSRIELLQYLKRLQQEKGMGVVMVTHSMDDLAEYADRVVVIEDGGVKMDMSVRQVFWDEETVVEAGLSIPAIVDTVRTLRNQGMELQPEIIRERELLQTLGLVAID